MNFKKFLISSAFTAASIGGVCGATSWTASADLIANEIPDGGGGTETTNPNFKVPEWSYGFRDAVASTSQTLFALADHNNSIAGFPAIQGWQNSFMTVAVNVSGSAVGSLGPGQLTVHPMATADPFTFNVIRWTAPITGTYQLSASWFVPSLTSDGVDAHVVVNGISLFDTVVGPNATQSTSQSLLLVAGTFLDFVVGPGTATTTNDSTTFEAVITLVPEPTSTLMIAAAMPLFFVRRRTMNPCR